jgi:type IV pilus assembly protein PilX
MMGNSSRMKITTVGKTMSFPCSCYSFSFPKRQNGVVLLIALIVLVAMTLAGIALVRSVDTGNMVAGNLAFKHGTTLAADAGINAAIAYLVPLNGTSTTYEDQAAFGYYATSQDTLDLTGTSNNPARARVDWDNNDCSGVTASACIKPAAADTDDATGNSVKYVIHRLCQSTGDSNATSNSCVTYKSTSGTSPKRGELKYGDDKRFEPLPAVYYRITARATGPRNTVSFVETMIHF